MVTSGGGDGKREPTAYAARKRGGNLGYTLRAKLRTMSDKRLNPIGTFAAQGDIETILYSVTGLSPDDMCVIGYAGRDFDGKRRWSLTWYRNAKRLSDPDVLYDSPEDALKAVEKLQTGS